MAVGTRELHFTASHLVRCQEVLVAVLIRVLREVPIEYLIPTISSIDCL